MAHLVCYQPEGRVFDSQWCHWDFSLTNNSSRTMARGSNRPLTKSEYQEYLLGVKVIYRIIIVPVVLYGCESWSFTLREERKLRVF